MPRLNDEIRSMIGMRTPLQKCCDVVEAGAVRRFAQAIMDRDPIYADREHAAQTRYGAPVAPPLFPTAMFRPRFDEPDMLHERSSDPKFDGVVGSLTFGLPRLPVGPAGVVNGGVDVEFYRYARHGEEVFLEASYENIVERQTKKGWALFVYYDCKFLDKDGGLIVRYKRVQIWR